MNKLDTFKTLLHKKSALLKCIFSTLLFQFLVTTLIVMYIYNHSDLFGYITKEGPSLLYLFLFLLVSIFLIIAMTGFDLSFQSRFFLFILFSVIEGFFLGFVTKYISKEIIYSALSSTLAIFSTFLVIGFMVVYFGYDLSWLGVFLFIALLGIIIYQIVLFFLPPSQTQMRFVVTFVLILFSIFILYDTNNILLKYKNNDVDCIRGALEYYLDIINIFVYSLHSQ